MMKGREETDFFCMNIDLTHKSVRGKQKVCTFFLAEQLKMLTFCKKVSCLDYRKMRKLDQTHFVCVPIIMKIAAAASCTFFGYGEICMILKK